MPYAHFSYYILLKYSCGQVHKPWALAKTWFKTFCRTWDQECKKLYFFVTKNSSLSWSKLKLVDTLTVGSRVRKTKCAYEEQIILKIKTKQ